MDKNIDKKGRWRNVIVSFRMSPEERDDLNARVKLSGLTKQDYVIKRLLEREVIVIPSSRLYKAMREQMTEILSELKRLENGKSVDGDLLAIIETVVETYNGLQEK
jgi:uncharacterized protein (DUF1778 family)